MKVPDTIDPMELDRPLDWAIEREVQHERERQAHARQGFLEKSARERNSDER